MEYRTIYLNQYSSKIELTRFAAADVEEAHAILHVDANGELFESQLRRLQLSLQTFMQELEMEGHKMVFMRYFLSDATNQAPLMTMPASRSSSSRRSTAARWHFGYTPSAALTSAP